MHSAPAVSYPVGRSHFHGVMLAGVLLVSAATLTAWTMQSDTAGIRHLAAALLWLASALTDDEVELALSGELDPAVVRPSSATKKEGRDFLAVVMPMRI